MTVQEQKVAEVMAATGSQAFTAYRIGMSESGVSAAVRRPAVQAETARIQQEMLFSDVLPLAVERHKAILADPTTPPGALVQAIKLAYDRTLGEKEGAAGKDMHEMSSEDIARAIADLERVAADRAKLVEGGIFG